jgi:hypothetical protein
MAGIVTCYGDDFTLHYGGRNALSGDHAGKAPALAVLADFSAAPTASWSVSST